MRGCQRCINQKRSRPARRDGVRLFSGPRLQVISRIPVCFSHHWCLFWSPRFPIKPRGGDKEEPPRGLLFCPPCNPHPCLFQGTEASWTSWTCQTPTSTPLMGEFSPVSTSLNRRLLLRGMPAFHSQGCVGGGDVMPLRSAEGCCQACHVGHDSGPGTRACLESFQSQKTLCLFL